MPAKSRKIGAKTFEKTGDAIDYYLRIRDKYKPKGRLSAEDEAEILALVACHPEYDEKRGRGIDYIYVAQDEQKTNWCFWIARVDGSADDLSVRACVRGAPIV